MTEYDWQRRPNGGGAPQRQDPTMQGIADIDLKPGGRSSSAYRDRFAAHLREMYAEGHMTRSELDTRLSAIDRLGENMTQEQLRVIISDLPGLPLSDVPHRAWFGKRWDKLDAKQRLTVYAAGVGVGVGTLVGGITAAAHTTHLLPMIASVFLAIVGIVGAILIVILACLDDKINDL